MVDIRINYETLFDLLRREKNREELQTMDKDFYEQVLAYLKEKKDSLSKKDDELFASAEREKLKIQFQNIRRIIKELYERREKKVINMAMSRARTGSDVIDTSALLPSEKEFFNEQVMLFIKFKDKVLDRILTLKEFDNAKPEAEQKEPTDKKEEAEAKVEAEQQEAPPTSAAPAVPATSTGFVSASLTDKKRIRITDLIPKFIGLKGEVLGPFNDGEEVELDAQIAELLVKRGKAEDVE